MKKIILDKSQTITFLLMRTDRLGDTALSIQCIEALKINYPNSKVIFALKSYTAPLLKNNPFVDEVICIDKYDKKDLIELIKSKKIDISISLFASKEACYLPFSAKIPIRIGPFSKFRSLLFTHKIVQSRSKSEKHEAVYNLELLKPLGINKLYYPKIYLDEEEKQWAKDFLKSKKISHPLVILHPGTGGSSKDWSVQNFFILAQKLLMDKNINILITGSQKELQNYNCVLKDFPKIKSENLLSEEIDLRKLFGVISHADCFVANSTGPLHCASALHIPTISFYPMLRVAKPQRWQPFNSNPLLHNVVTPMDNGEPLKECFKCTDKCPYYFCMDSIEVAKVYSLILENLYK